MFAQPWMIWKVLKNMIPATKSLSQLSETFYALEDTTKRLEDGRWSEFDGNRPHAGGISFDLIHSITRKYGAKSRTYWNTWRKSPKNIAFTGSDLSSEDLEKELKRLEKSLITLLKIWVDQRHDPAQDLENEIQQELADLYMDKARFRVLARLSLIVREMKLSNFTFRPTQVRILNPLSR